MITIRTKEDKLVRGNLRLPIAIKYYVEDDLEYLIESLCKCNVEDAMIYLKDIKNGIYLYLEDENS